MFVLVTFGYVYYMIAVRVPNVNGEIAGFWLILKLILYAKYGLEQGGDSLFLGQSIML